MNIVIATSLYLIGAIIFGVWTLSKRGVIEVLKDANKKYSFSVPLISMYVLCMLWPISTIVSIYNMCR